QFRLRHDWIERWLGIRPFLWQDPMTPVNIFNRALINYAFGEGQSPSRNSRRRFRTKESREPSRKNQTCGRAEKQNDCETHAYKSGWREGPLLHVIGDNEGRLFGRSMSICFRCPGTIFKDRRRGVLPLFVLRGSRESYGVGRGAGVGRGRGSGVALGVELGV